jgi:hypothetical protein
MFVLPDALRAYHVRFRKCRESGQNPLDALPSARYCPVSDDVLSSTARWETSVCCFQAPKYVSRLAAGRAVSPWAWCPGQSKRARSE